VGLLFICYALAMRSAPKSEQEKLEIEAAERTDRRKGAFKYMNIRDRGWGQINDLHNKRSAVMHWHVSVPLEEGVPRRQVPDGVFTLDVAGQVIAFDVEEFRKLLRWA
jgi:hypothetical protein